MSVKSPFGGIQVSSGDMAYATSFSDAYADVVNILGKGYLTGISQVLGKGTNSRTGKIKIIIDGSTIYDGDFSKFDEKYSSDKIMLTLPMSLAFLIPFKSSLQVQHAISATTIKVYTTVSYAIN